MGLQKVDQTSEGAKIRMSTFTLFIMCAEAFSNLLMQTKRQKIIHGLKFDEQVTVSHQLFADDSPFFLEPPLKIVKT